MKTLRLYGAALLASFALLFQSCDDDGYSIGDFAVDLVTVHVEGDGVYSFTGDTWGTMWAGATSLIGYSGNEGDRAMLYFNPLQDDYAGYDVAIKSEYIKPILTKTIEELTAENEEEYGNDPAYITNVWIAGGYLNMNFRQKYPNKEPHRVSLVRNLKNEAEAVAEDDGFIHLEYRYNTYGDTLNHFVPGMVCYNLSTLNEELETAKGIKLKIRSAVNGYRTLTFTKESSGTPEETAKLNIAEMKVK